MIEQSRTELSLRRQCWLLSVSRAGLSYQPVKPDDQTLQMMRRLDEWYVEHSDLGHRRLVVLLKREGWQVNIKRVRRLRTLMGLNQQFDCSNLDNGTYRLSLTAGDETITKTFVIQANPNQSFLVQ